MIAIRGGNSITNNGSVEALGLYGGSHAREDNAFTGTGNVIVGAETGIGVFGDSSLDIRQATVTAPDNYVSFDSSLRIGSDTFGGDPANIVVSGNVTASHSSTMSINVNANMNGMVSCKSFSTLNNVSLSGTGTVKCPFEIKTQGFSVLNPKGIEDLFLDEGGNIYIAGTFNPTSSRNSKKGFEQVDSMDILNRVMELPITEWNYKRDDDTLRHIGPVSEDFYSVFGLGRDDKSISTTDSSGIALAAIQGLKRQQDMKDLEITRLRDEVDRLGQLVNQLISENLGRTTSVEETYQRVHYEIREIGCQDSLLMVRSHGCRATNSCID